MHLDLHPVLLELAECHLLLVAKHAHEVLHLAHAVTGSGSSVHSASELAIAFHVELIGKLASLVGWNTGVHQIAVDLALQVVRL